jgi:hypothetical protein
LNAARSSRKLHSKAKTAGNAAFISQNSQYLRRHQKHIGENSHFQQRLHIMADQYNLPIQWRILLVVLALLIVIAFTVIAVDMDVAEAIPLVGVPFLAWLAWKIFGVSGVGMIFWAISLELGAWAIAIATRAEGDVFAIIPFYLLFLVTVACILFAEITIVVYAIYLKTKPRRNLLAALIAPILLVLLAFLVISLYGGARQLRIARYLQTNGPTFQALIDDVDTISLRLGRVPNDEEELVELRKQPMPRIPWPHWGGHDIQYHAIDENRFELYFGGIDMERLYVYDSSAPEKGWNYSGMIELHDNDSPPK